MTPYHCAIRSPEPPFEFHWFQLIFCHLFLEAMIDEDTYLPGEKGGICSAMATPAQNWKQQNPII